jgi:hypothetical protein
MSLSSQRCYNHGEREAVARCPECGRFHCRECVTEVRDRLLCTACVASLRMRQKSWDRNVALARLRRSSAIVVGFLVAWLCFLGLARILFSIPSRFHDGSAWHGSP